MEYEIEIGIWNFTMFSKGGGNNVSDHIIGSIALKPTWLQTCQWSVNLSFSVTNKIKKNKSAL